MKNRKLNPNDPLGNPVYFLRPRSKQHELNKFKLHGFAAKVVLAKSRDPIKKKVDAPIPDAYMKH